MDDGSDVGNGGETSGSVKSNVGKYEPKTVNFRPLFTLAGNGVDVHVPKESSSLVNERFNNTVYGFFMGKRFGSKEEMEAMLKSGPWLIRNVPLILKQWTPDANIMKEDVPNIHIWIKFHDVPITAFIEDGLSGIATKLCYARAMIELRADVDLRDTIVVDIPKFSGEGFTTRTIHVEYEWAPPKYAASRGPQVGLKPKSNFVYRSVPTKKAAKANGNPKVQTANKATTPILNSFDALSTLVDEEEGGGNQTPSTNVTPLVAKINEPERRILDEKLVLVNKHGKPLEMKVTNEASVSKPSTSIGDQLVESDEDEVELPDDETSRYMFSTSGGGFHEDDLDFMTDTRLRFSFYELHKKDTTEPESKDGNDTEDDDDKDDNCLI
ncbi:putative RNA-directed DNA polymerase [Tanacetum coccineum]|uniref:RNA-directed DNA polymerase n=1 Tax=Tanacetum coccineum TaxID=301880 RepID=A0ABQ5BEJ8_9ASTR